MRSTPLKDLPRLTSCWPVHTTAAPGYLSGLAPQHLAGGPRQPWSSSKEACHSGGKPLHTNMHTKIESRPHSHPHQRPVADISSPTPVVASPAEASPFHHCAHSSHIWTSHTAMLGESLQIIVPTVVAARPQRQLGLEPILPTSMCMAVVAQLQQEGT